MKNIYLVGMPGSGKSTLGRLIADKLQRQFIDTDEEIRLTKGETPEQIITLQGEERLRELEKELLRELLSTTDRVVSTGGGFPVFNENMKHMNAHGITVYLHYNAETLWRRLEQDRVRPLSPSREAAEKLLLSRERVYRKALIIIEGVEDIERNIEMIYDAIRKNYPDEL